MHAIDVSTGQAACAYRGETPWHGLGTALDDNATVEQWVVAAGLNWNAVKAPVRYAMPDGTTRDYYGRSVIYRDDTEAALGVVSDSYQIVQPREVVEFFKDAVGQADMKLEVAGALFDGKRFWATARLNADELIINGVDEIRPYVLLITSADGSLATNASLVSTRVVCNNTAQIAMRENGQRVRVTHAAQFDSNIIKSRMGLIDGAWGDFKAKVLKMAETEVSKDQAYEFFIKLLMDESKKNEDPNALIQKKANDFVDRFLNGIGAESHAGNAWGLYCATTEHTNYSGRGGDDHRMWAALYGSKAKMVQKAEDLIEDLVMA